MEFPLRRLAKATGVQRGKRCLTFPVTIISAKVHHVLLCRSSPSGMFVLTAKASGRDQTRRTTMSYSSVIRCSGLTDMVAGVVLLIAELLELLTGFGDESFSELAQTVPFIFQQALYLL